MAVYFFFIYIYGLVGVSTLLGYLITKSCLYILNMICKYILLK